MLWGLLAAVIFLPIGWGLQQASALVMTHLPHWKMEPQEQLPIHALRVSLSWGGRLALGAAAVLLAPVAEEALFRGILYPAIKQLELPRLALWGNSPLFQGVLSRLFRRILYPAIKRLGFPRLALWGNSLLFAAIHMNLVTFVPLLVLALVLTALYERTNNLLAPITAHVLFNLLNFVMLLILQQTGSL